jgi:hypothetical protein
MAFRACFCAFLSCCAFVLSLVFILSLSFFFASGCLYPMHWERVYIAPTTFLFGLPTNCTCFLLDLFFLVSSVSRSSSVVVVVVVVVEFRMDGGVCVLLVSQLDGNWFGLAFVI